MKKDDVEILARTIYGEARGEYSGRVGIAALIAVGNVVMNRLNARCWYGSTIQEICQKPMQFSCWNRDDPNRSILMQESIDDPILTICREVATNVSRNQWPDMTKGSNHYHASTMSVYPQWAQNTKPKVHIGNHIFYQLKKGV